MKRLMMSVMAVGLALAISGMAQAKPGPSGGGPKGPGSQNSVPKNVSPSNSGPKSPGSSHCYTKNWCGWSSCCWAGKYNCYCYYCPTACCYYYWYAPLCCYLPYSYIQVYPPTTPYINVVVNIN